MLMLAARDGAHSSFGRLPPEERFITPAAWRRIRAPSDHDEHLSSRTYLITGFRHSAGIDTWVPQPEPRITIAAFILPSLLWIPPRLPTRRHFDRLKSAPSLHDTPLGVDVSTGKPRCDDALPSIFPSRHGSLILPTPFTHCGLSVDGVGGGEEGRHCRHAASTTTTPQGAHTLMQRHTGKSATGTRRCRRARLLARAVDGCTRFRCLPNY